MQPALYLAWEAPKEMARVILNGKKAHQEDFRQAVDALRSQGAEIEVRVTWEREDPRRFVEEAVRDGVKRLVAAGGDGTLHEIVNGLYSVSREKRPELAIVPMGTGNDFATACKVPLDPMESLRLAVFGESVSIDLASANDQIFINVATGGFASAASRTLPASLKNLLGGSAYRLAAALKAFNFAPGTGRIRAEGIELSGSALAGAVCNGRQAGGGQVLAPSAFLNDGLLDVILILTFPVTDVGRVVNEFFDKSNSGKYVKRFRTSWLDLWPSEKRTVNLDGEPYEADFIHFEVLPGALEMVLPKNCPCIRA